MKKTTLDGLVLVDKPAGITSHGVVARLRRVLGTRKIGHGGTLDPPATGLLVAFTGKATRLAQYLGGGDKVYEATFRFGVATNTDDAEGEVLREAPAPELSLDEWRSGTECLVGEIQQVPPAVSAVHVNGKRAYKIARKGGEPQLSPRKVTVHGIEVLEWSAPRLRVRITCGTGTYIRSIARDWGEALGSCAHVETLRRTHSGPFDVADAETLDEIERRADEGTAVDVIHSPVPALESVLGAPATLSGAQAQRFLHGNPCRPDGDVTETGDTVFAIDEQGRLLGLGAFDAEGRLLPSMVWAAPE